MTIRTATARVLLAFASADISRKELHDFLRWVDETGPDRVAELIGSIQRTAQDVQGQYGRGLFDDRSFETARHLSERQLASRIEKLMLESGLTKAAMVRATVGLLKERGYAPNSIPDPTKIAFRAWIEKLLRHIKAEDLLNVASIVRNHAVHGIDWPLRREKT